MRSTIPTRTLALALALAPACASLEPDYGRPLPPGAPALIPLGEGEAVPDLSSQWAAREEIRTALGRSLAWMRRPHAAGTYPMAGITYERALASLERLDELLANSLDGASFAASIEAEFTFYKSAGWDGRGGGVLFTAYCTPIFRGSLERSERFRYPLYALPPDLEKGPGGSIRGWRTEVGLVPYPTRQTIESGALLAERGLELVWLEDPIDAFIAHVNGSAFIELGSGPLLRFGYAGKNGREYTSLGKELIAEGLVPEEGISLQAIREWARGEDPERVRELLHRNDSYVFFQPIDGNPHGSLDVEVQERRSLATDKTLFPRAAACFVQTRLPTGGAVTEAFEELVFDQDTGGAIRTAGRADIYLGIGPEAESLAGLVASEGQLYYLFLDE